MCATCGAIWYGMVWYDMIWYGMVWYGMVWYGMVWYGMVWYGMVWHQRYKDTAVQINATLIHTHNTVVLTTRKTGTAGQRYGTVGGDCAFGMIMTRDCCTALPTNTRLDMAAKGMELKTW